MAFTGTPRIRAGSVLDRRRRRRYERGSGRRQCRPSRPCEPGTPGHAALDRSAGVAGLLAYAMIGLLVVLVGDDLTPAWWAVWAVGLPLYAIALLVDLPRRTALTLLVPMALVA